MKLIFYINTEDNPDFIRAKGNDTKIIFDVYSIQTNFKAAVFIKSGPRYEKLNMDVETPVY